MKSALGQSPRARSPLIVTLSTVLLLGSCGSDDDDEEMRGASTPDPIDTFEQDRSFTLVATNLTAGQPLSPPLLVVHDGSFRLFTIGMPASDGLELLAEGGDGSQLQKEADANPAVSMTLSADSPLAPGGRTRLSLAVKAGSPDPVISLATMLVNTNDGFTAIDSRAIGSLEVGETLHWRSVAYDAGTESNSERTGSLPGPADGGEGFNPQRDDIADEVRMHSGVLTASDGPGDSILTEKHRFLNPVIDIRVTRTE